MATCNTCSASLVAFWVVDHAKDTILACALWMTRPPSEPPVENAPTVKDTGRVSPCDCQQKQGFRTPKLENCDNIVVCLRRTSAYSTICADRRGSASPVSSVSCRL